MLDSSGSMDTPCNSKAKALDRQCRGVDRVGDAIIEKFQCDYSVSLNEVSEATASAEREQGRQRQPTHQGSMGELTWHHAHPFEI